MAYGQILQNQVAGVITDTVGNATKCVFLAQDVTAAGVQRALPRIFTSAKAATTFTVTNSTAAGAVNFDALVVTPHSLVDVGPIVAGNTRGVGAANVSPYVSAAFPGYRSLHTGVSFVVLAGAANVDVVVTHRLATASTVAFVSPLLDPVDAGAVGDLVKVFRTASAADTITLRMVLASGGVFVADTTVTFDVMVLSRFGAGFGRGRVGRRHFTAALANGDDYAAGDRAQTGVLPTSAAVYTNVDAIVAGGLVVTHNLGASTNVIALVGHTETPGLGVPVITNNATSTTTCTIARQGGDMNNNYVGIFRPYSVISL